MGFGVGAGEGCGVGEGVGAGVGEGVGCGVGPGVTPPPPLPDGIPALGNVGTLGKKFGGKVKICGGGVGEGKVGTFEAIMEPPLGELPMLPVLMLPLLMLPPLPSLPGIKTRDVSAYKRAPRAYKRSRSWPSTPLRTTRATSENNRICIVNNCLSLQSRATKCDASGGLAKDVLQGRFVSDCRGMCFTA